MREKARGTVGFYHEGPEEHEGGWRGEEVGIIMKLSGIGRASRPWRAAEQP